MLEKQDRVSMSEYSSSRRQARAPWFEVPSPVPQEGGPEAWASPGQRTFYQLPVHGALAGPSLLLPAASSPSLCHTLRSAVLSSLARLFNSGFCGSLFSCWCCLKRETSVSTVTCHRVLRYTQVIPALRKKGQEEEFKGILGQTESEDTDL